MRVFAIGDLHLPANTEKPMDVFGEKWGNHFRRISEDWLSLVESEDAVLIPGDLSWAMHLEDAAVDLAKIGALPGRKIILRGNHDYWWTSVSKLRSMLPEGMYALQNDSISMGDFTFCGSRGWLCPGAQGYSQSNDEKIYKREQTRLELSLRRTAPEKRIIMMLHYPPFNEKNSSSAFTELAEKYGVEHVVYAHLHGFSCKNAFEGERNGVKYTLCSCDHLDFKLKLIAQST